MRQLASGISDQPALHDVIKMSDLSIIEFVAYAIIGLASFLAVGGAMFLTALVVFERMEDSRVNRRARKGITLSGL